MFITKYDQKSGTAFTIPLREYMHLLLIGGVIITAPVLGPAAYFLSWAFPGGDRGYAFIVDWFFLFLGTCVLAAIYFFIYDLRARRAYDENTAAALGIRRLPSRW